MWSCWLLTSFTLFLAPEMQLFQGLLRDIWVMFLFEAKLFPPCEAGGAVPVMYLSPGFERRLKVGFRVCGPMLRPRSQVQLQRRRFTTFMGCSVFHVEVGLLQWLNAECIICTFGPWSYFKKSLRNSFFPYATAKKQLYDQNLKCAGFFFFLL